LGVLSRAKIEKHLRGLEGKPLLPRGVAVGPNGKAVATPGKWEVKEAKKYNPDADGLAGDEPAAIAPELTKAKKEAKKEKKSKAKDVKMIEVVEEDSDDSEAEESEEEVEEEESEDEEEEDEDEEMADVDAGLGLPAPALNGTKAKPVANIKTIGADDHSETLSTVSADTPNSPDSPTQQETNWQSSILGNTKEAKKQERRNATNAD